MKKQYILIVLLLIYYLNDLVNIFVKNIELWILIDYFLVRGATLLIIVWIIKKEICDAKYFGLKRMGWANFLLWFVPLLLYGVAVDQYLWPFLEKYFISTKLGGWPGYTSNFIKWIDLIIGIGLTAVTEELVFRGFLVSYFKEKKYSMLEAVLLSSIIFGFAHWSLGVHAIITTTIWGLLPAYYFWRYGTIYPLIIVHYIVDFMAFL